MTDRQTDRQTDRRKFPLILTGTIDPRPFGGELRDLDARLHSHETSTEKYICDTKFDPIVFAENSGYSFDVSRYQNLAAMHHKTFEFVKGTMCCEEVAEHGKGYGDSLLVYEALKNSASLEEVSFFYKITGRIFLKNSDQIISSCDKYRDQFISYGGMGWVMTYLFKADKADYLRVMDGVHLQCDDKKRRDMEICFWLRLYASDLDIGCFTTYPVIEGNMGETTILYTKGKVDTLLRILATKAGLFHMKSKNGQFIWKIYQKLTGRRPYVTPKDI